MKSIIDKLTQIVEEAKTGTPEPLNAVDLGNIFKVSSPVFKLNFPPETPQIVLGHYLALDKGKLKFETLVDVTNLYDDTILFFTDRHKIELAYILYGMAIQRETNHGQTKIVQRYLTQCAISGTTYREYHENCHNHVSGTWEINDVMTRLPFITYNDIDELAKEAIQYFEEHPEDYHDGPNSNPGTTA